MNNLDDHIPVGWVKARQILKESGEYDEIYKSVFGRYLPADPCSRGRAIQSLEVFLSEKSLEEISQILVMHAN